MGRPAKDPLDAVRADVERRFKNYLEDFAGEMTYQIESAYESVIDSFYAEYEPRSYRRTFSTYEASDKTNDLFGFTPVSDGYEAGITVDSENIPGKPYRADTHWVFTRTFKEGIHGFTKAEYSKWKEKREFGLKVEYSLNGIQGGLNAYLQANRNKSILYRSKKIPKKYFVKSIKAKSPKEAMDKSYKHLTTKKNMDIISDAIFEKHFS